MPCSCAAKTCENESSMNKISEASHPSAFITCSKDHSTKEIQAWGHRSYREDQRVSAIKNDLVWVVEEKGSIQGYGHLKIFEKDGLKCGHIFGLYLTPQVLGKSLGRTIVDMMMQEVMASNVKQVT